MNTDYWAEGLDEALKEAGLQATPEQLNAIAQKINDAYSAIDESTGTLSMTDPRNEEIQRLTRQLERERSKDVCGKCKGKGGWRDGIGSHIAHHTCPDCQGSGLVYEN